MPHGNERFQLLLGSILTADSGWRPYSGSLVGSPAVPTCRSTSQSGLNWAAAGTDRTFREWGCRPVVRYGSFGLQEGV